MKHDINNKAANTSVQTHIPNSGLIQCLWNKPCQEKGIVYTVIYWVYKMRLDVGAYPENTAVWGVDNDAAS